MEEQEIKTEEMGMKWYKWMIRVALFVSAAWNLVLGIIYLSGSIYNTDGISAELVYAVFPSLKTYDIIYGISMLVLAWLEIYTRFRLAKFKRGAPELLYLCYTLCLVAEFAYLGFASDILETSVYDTQSIVYMVTQAIMLLINIIYFKKRKNLFVN